MKKIIISLSIVSAVAAVVVGATTAFFNDTETASATFTAGTIDISVDNNNPWNGSYALALDKPCEVNYINFIIKNIGTNPANVWKRINNIVTGPGQAGEGIGGYFCTCGAEGTEDDVWVSSEPECYEGTNQCTEAYVERDNLASYMIYDMSTCRGNQANCLTNGDAGAPSNDQWVEIIPEENEIRIDNVNEVWVYLGQLAAGEEMKVNQSYHLMAWNDAGEEEITNWAQGDTMEFDIELEARQLSASAPGAEDGERTLTLKSKDDTTWLSDGGNGTLIYNVAGDTFDYSFSASGLDPSVSYDLIYYADPWPGIGQTGIADALIGTYPADTNGDIATVTGNKDFGYDLPHEDDANHPAGAKIWLVLADDYNETTNSMNAWNPGQYLFEMNLIQYDYTPPTP